MAKKVTILAKYLNYANIFPKEVVVKLPKHLDINEYIIDLEPNKQLPYESIYNLGLVELKTFKTYIETNLANSFIRLFKSSARALILFVQKLDGSFHLYVDYQSLNNLTIKHWYKLSLIGELLDRLKQAKQFTQLDLTKIYH